jgi:hypothetical protein
LIERRNRLFDWRVVVLPVQTGNCRSCRCRRA